MNIDMETGEILEGTPDLTLLAHDLYQAQQQLRAWEAHVNALKAILLQKQQEKNVVYDDLIVSVRQAVRVSFDAGAYQDSLNYGQLTAETLIDIIDAAKDFDPKKLPIITEPLRFASYQETKPYVVVDLVRRPAPEA